MNRQPSSILLSCYLGAEPRGLWLGHIERGAHLLREKSNMLWTIFMVLVVLWLLGLATSYTLGAFIHLLLVVAVAILLIRLIQGRRLAA